MKKIILSREEKIRKRKKELSIIKKI